MRGYENKHYDYAEWLNGLLALLYARLSLEEMRGSMRYQQERYGPLVSRPPNKRGGVAEDGSELFTPLHNPESAKRFMDFLDRGEVGMQDFDGGNSA